MSFTTFAALAVIALVAVLIVRRVDVRLVLTLGALPLFIVTGKLPEMLVKFAAEMANPGTVVPICSAVGFAYVLKLTECDQHLVHLLLRPLRRIRALLIPGGIAAAYVVNSAVVSQTGTAAVVGPILLPLLRATGISPVTAGSLLLLGSSMGGELFNPGAVEIRTLASRVHLSSTEVVARTARLNLMACTTALLVMWWLALRAERHARQPLGTPKDGAGPEKNAEDTPVRVNLVKAAVPLLPLALLFSASAVADSYLPRDLSGPVRILAAMLVGVLAAGLTTPRLAGGLSTAFFEGAGYAYTHVISLIVVATLFAEGIRETGLIHVLSSSLVGWPFAALFVAEALPWLLAFVSGTGIAPAVAVIDFLVPEAHGMGLDPVRVGALTALGAHFGRTMSPVAAVVAMSAALSQTSRSDLIQRVVWPLLAGGVVMFLAVLLRVL